MNYLSKYLSASFLMIAALFFVASSRPALAQTVPPLGAAQTFAVLGGTPITTTGPAVISGNVGVSPGSVVTGFPPTVVQKYQYTRAWDRSLPGPEQCSRLTENSHIISSVNGSPYEPRAAVFELRRHERFL